MHRSNACHLKLPMSNEPGEGNHYLMNEEEAHAFCPAVLCPTGRSSTPCSGSKQEPFRYSTYLRAYTAEECIAANLAERQSYFQSSKLQASCARPTEHFLAGWSMLIGVMTKDHSCSLAKVLRLSGGEKDCLQQVSRTHGEVSLFGCFRSID
jgi:hypothetical protein